MAEFHFPGIVHAGSLTCLNRFEKLLLVTNFFLLGQVKRPAVEKTCMIQTHTSKENQPDDICLINVSVKIFFLQIFYSKTPKLLSGEPKCPTQIVPLRIPSLQITCNKMLLKPNAAYLNETNQRRGTSANYTKVCEICYSVYLLLKWQ